MDTDVVIPGLTVAPQADQDIRAVDLKLHRVGYLYTQWYKTDWLRAVGRDSELHARCVYMPQAIAPLIVTRKTSCDFRWEIHSGKIMVSANFHVRLDEVCNEVPIPETWGPLLQRIQCGKAHAEKLPQVLQDAMGTRASVTCQHSSDSIIIAWLRVMFT